MKERHKETNVILRISISEHLDTLRVEENKKPPSERREVPSVADLVRLTGLNRANLFSGKYQSVNLDALAAVINALRGQGFPATITDLLSEYPEEGTAKG